MIDLKYVNSKNEEINFRGDNIRIADGNWHIRTWNPIITNRSLGGVVKRFGKDPQTFQTTVTLRGDLESRYAMADALCMIFEEDVLSCKAGKLYFGNSYVNCFATTSDTHVSNSRNTRTDIVVTFYAPYPFWVTEQKKSFYPIDREEEEREFFDYNYDYGYDYTMESPGVGQMVIDHYTDSDFFMTIYGPAVNPSININGNAYIIYVTLDAGEYLTLDTRSTTPTRERIVKHMSSGIEQNVYDMRGKQFSVFTKLPPGVLNFAWNGSFGFDITVFIERSEPKWSS